MTRPRDRRHAESATLAWAGCVRAELSPCCTTRGPGWDASPMRLPLAGCQKSELGESLAGRPLVGPAPIHALPFGEIAGVACVSRGREEAENQEAKGGCREGGRGDRNSRKTSEVAGRDPDRSGRGCGDVGQRADGYFTHHRRRRRAHALSGIAPVGVEGQPTGWAWRGAEIRGGGSRETFRRRMGRFPADRRR